MHQLISQVEYILTEYQFDISSVSERLLCILCKNLLRNACQTPCGCKGCKICFETYLDKDNKLCPNNSNDCEKIFLDINENIYLDNATNKEILYLNLKCPFNFCVYKDLLKNMGIHIDNCEYKETMCDQCLKKFVKKDKASHDDSICEMRMVVCQYCDESMSYRNLNSIHLDINNDNLCCKLFDYCPNKCLVKYKVLLKEHLQQCSNKLFACPFNLISCKLENKQNKQNILKHFKEENVNHMNSLINKINELQKETEYLECRIKTLKQVNNKLIVVPESTVDGQHELRSCFEESQTINSSRNKNPEKILLTNGSFIWKINNFFRKKQESVNGGILSFVSDPFYTNEFGYKLCMKIYPNGDGIGKDTHLSVFFVIMKGDFDDILSWPFKQKVTMGILDQVGNGKSIFETFKPDVRSTCYQKPTDELNIASGSPKFILINNLIGNSPYCRNDTIYLKIMVDN